MTGVATELGLDRFRVPDETVACWDSWADQDERLAALDDPRDLRRWLQQAPFRQVNAGLQALGWLANVDGGDDPAAALTLAWAVLPGMTRLAHSLRQLTDDIDHAVAARVWMAVRTVPGTRHAVAARLRFGVRDGVLADHLRDTRIVPFGDRLPRPSTGGADVPAAAVEELLDLLDWACETSVIEASDRDLLLSLVNATTGDMWLRSDSRGGLLGAPSHVIARDQGVSVRTLQRRAGRCIDALAAAAGAYLTDVNQGRRPAA